MALPDFSMRQLLEAGAHFGHQTHRWNPRMAPYIYGERNGIHIIDLSQSVPLLHQALKQISDTVAGGGRVLFVGTKRQAADSVAESARQSAQYFMNARWLGGTLTNWKTISNSIQRLRKLEELLSGEAQGLTKKELLKMTREKENLDRALGGIKDMGGVPDLLFVIDTNKEAIAIKEAKRLNIPVVAVLDSNCNPEGIDYPIPGNDDAGRAIALYCDLVARAALDGISRGQSASGVDIGAAAEPEPEAVVAAPVEEEAPTQISTEEEGTIEAPEMVFERLEAPRGAPDELTKITGLGPTLETKLNEAGIFHFWQISAMDDEQGGKIEEEVGAKGRIKLDAWRDEARKLMEAGA
ncbi:30S ribosomal protein S2 [Tepidamorphus sp. 3E244]|uniref:30S ribosomal protein S2 n=1 Tax=Tepidamorphus sp. 3E244 TaxID=3385498 RepID=UPI0038FCC940